MIYLDNSATTSPKEDVLKSFVEVNRKFFANPASLHLLGKEAEKLLERSREQILSLVSAEDGKVVFTSGGTEANNLAILGLARAYRSRGNHIITTSVEHPSVLNAAKKLEEEGFEVDYLTVDDEGCISVEELQKRLNEETILVSIMHVNNEIGTIQPIKQCAQIIKRNSRAIFHSDAVQSFGKLPVTIASEGPDVLTISAHKINGLKGSGVLVMRKGIQLEAINYGGGQEKGYRSGTVSVADAVAIAKAMRLTVENERSTQYKAWRERLIDCIKPFENVRILAANRGAPHILSVTFPHIKGEVAVNHFQKNGITISTSSACSSKSGEAGTVIESLRLPEMYKHGAIRISFGETTVEKQIEKVEEVFLDFMNLLERGKHHGME